MERGREGEWAGAVQGEGRGGSGGVGPPAPGAGGGAGQIVTPSIWRVCTAFAGTDTATVFPET